MKKAVQKMSLPVVFDEKGNPKAIVFLNGNRDRVIYVCEKADEDEIVELLTSQTKNE